MKVVINSIAISIALFLGACASTQVNDAPVSGKISNIAAGTKIYLESLETRSVQMLDSVVLTESGEFQFKPAMGSKSFYRLRLGSRDAVILILDSTEKAIVTADGAMFSRSYEVSGSEDSKIMRSLSRIIEHNFNQKDSINQLYQRNYNNLTEEMVADFSLRLEQIEKGFTASLKSFISENKYSLASLAAVEQLDIDREFETYGLLDKALAEKHPNSPHYQSFHEKYVYASKFSIGNYAPEILLPNPEGETTALSSLKGKVVLLDFWASWCKPCRMENPNVVRMYQQYADKNFEIFSVSLDRDRNAWIQAIAQDNMDWVHVSDLQFWGSPVVKQYNIKGIPHTLLLDADGKIIAKNLRGKYLEEKLKELFG